MRGQRGRRWSRRQRLNQRVYRKLEITRRGQLAVRLTGRLGDSGKAP